MEIPDIALYAMIAVLVISFAANMYFIPYLTDPLLKTISRAIKGDKRIAMVHYPSNQVVVSIPERVEGNNSASPYWLVDDSVRFKDITGEKWETMGGLKLIHYTARTPTPMSTNQAVGLDQLNSLLAWKGFSTKGYLKDVFYMITESAKGESAEIEAWGRLRVKDRHILSKIQEIVDFVKNDPEVKYSLFKSGVFTYQTAVSVVDQIIGTDVSNIANTISFVEDRTRRRFQDRTGEFAKYAIIATPIILATCIGGAIAYSIMCGGT